MSPPRGTTYDVAGLALADPEACSERPDVPRLRRPGLPNGEYVGVREPRSTVACAGGSLTQPAFVLAVLSRRAIGEIRQSVVVLVAVQMSDLLARRTRSDECVHDKLMYAHGASPTGQRAHADRQVRESFDRSQWATAGCVDDVFVPTATP